MAGRWDRDPAEPHGESRGWLWRMLWGPVERPPARPMAKAVDRYGRPYPLNGSLGLPPDSEMDETDRVRDWGPV